MTDDRLQQFKANDLKETLLLGFINLLTFLLENCTGLFCQISYLHC